MRDETDFLVTDYPDLPDDVPLVSSFHDYRNCLSYYYPKLRTHGDVNVPTTEFFEIHYDGPGQLPDFDEQAVAIWMRENDFQQAFVRSDYSSAKLHPRRGSLVYEPEPDVVRDTVAEMMAQHVMQRRLMGKYIVAREWLDLDYCPSHDVNDEHHSEVRYFIEDGEVLYHGPTKMEFYESHTNCTETYSYVMEDAMSGSIGFPHEQAEVVAGLFDELSWSVDFVRDAKTGEWYCTDMGLNGLYWEPDEKKWISLSGHWDESYSPEQYADEMPSIEELVEYTKDRSNRSPLPNGYDTVTMTDG